MTAEELTTEERAQLERRGREFDCVAKLLRLYDAQSERLGDLEAEARTQHVVIEEYRSTNVEQAQRLREAAELLMDVPGPDDGVTVGDVWCERRTTWLSGAQAQGHDCARCRLGVCSAHQPGRAEALLERAR